VRGDSLRDFYAKALALVGLGALAGVGAAVDYWPTATPLPVAAAISQRVAFTDLPIAPAPEHVQVARIAAVETTPTALADALVPPVLDRRVATPVLVATSQRNPQPSSLRAVSLEGPPARPAADTPFELAPAASLALAVEPLAVPHGTVLELVPATVLASAKPVERSEEADGHLLGDAASAARWAGESLVNTSGKAGASIVDGLTFVSRSIRRLKFF